MFVADCISNWNETRIPPIIEPIVWTIQPNICSKQSLICLIDQSLYFGPHFLLDTPVLLLDKCLIGDVIGPSKVHKQVRTGPTDGMSRNGSTVTWFGIYEPVNLVSCYTQTICLSLFCHLCNPYETWIDDRRTKRQNDDMTHWRPQNGTLTRS